MEGRISQVSSVYSETNKEGQNLIVEEEANEEGLFKTYVQYFSQSPGCFCNLGLLALSAVPFALMGYLRFFIASWAALPYSQQQQSGTKLQFIVVSVIQVGIAGFTTFVIGVIFIHLSNSLHNSMLKRVVQAPMRFFHSNPLGRIINRFSKDTAMADSVVASQVMFWLQVSFNDFSYSSLLWFTRY